MTHYRPYFAHRAIEDLAALLAGSGKIDGLLAVEAPVWMNRFPRLRWLITPLFFFGRLLHTRRGQIWLVRDFNNLQLLLAWPLYWPFRRRLIWINNHNLQNLRRQPWQRMLFRIALRTGLRLALNESSAGFVETFGNAAAWGPICLPYPMRQDEPKRSSGPNLTIGFAGRFRSDKGQEEAIDRLLADPPANCRIVIANPDEAVRNRYAARGCDVRDTASRQQFEAALQEIDIAILNYHRSHYEFRPSGIVRDLAEAGVVVVCPDFPVLRDQVSNPSPAGVTYSVLADLPAIIPTALALTHDIASLTAYRHYRSPQNIVRLLEEELRRAEAGT